MFSHGPALLWLAWSGCPLRLLPRVSPRLAPRPPLVSVWGASAPLFYRNIFLATSSREVAAATIYAAKLTELLPASTRGGRADIVLDLTYNAVTNQGHSSRGKPCGKS